MNYDQELAKEKKMTEIENLKIFLNKMTDYLDPDQPACSTPEQGDYYAQDAIRDLNKLEQTLKELYE